MTHDSVQLFLMSQSMMKANSIAICVQKLHPQESALDVWQITHDIIQLCVTTRDGDDIFEFVVLWLSQFNTLQETRNVLCRGSHEIWSHPAFASTADDWDALMQHIVDESTYETQDTRFACMRCKSTQVTVTTALVRFADEGMTEFRNCRNSGYISRMNA